MNFLLTRRHLQINEAFHKQLPNRLVLAWRGLELMNARSWPAGDSESVFGLERQKFP